MTPVVPTREEELREKLLERWPWWRPWKGGGTRRPRAASTRRPRSSSSGAGTTCGLSAFSFRLQHSHLALGKYVGAQGKALRKEV